MGDDDILIKSFLETSGFDAGADIIMGGLMRIGEIAVDAMFQAADAVKGFVEDSFAGALEAEQTMARIGNTIKATGGAAGMTTDDVAALGEQFAYLAGGSDDAVLAIEEMALRMGNISGEQMPDFIQASLDLAAATGVDAAAGARLLAQAYDDPASALTRFKKQGILFTDAQTEQIKKLQESGDVAGAFALVMDRVGEATSGAAAAQMDTAAGKIETFKNTIGEAGEEIAGAFLPALTTLFDQVIAPNLPALTALAGNMATLIQSFVSGAAPLELFGVSLQPIIDALGILQIAFMSTMPQATAATEQMVNTVIGLITQLGPVLIGNIASALTSIAAFWTAHGDEIIGRVTFLFSTLAQIFGGALLIIGGIVQVFTALLSGNWQLVFDGLAQIAQGAWNIISGIFTFWVNSILTYVGTNLDEVKSTWSGIFNDIGTLVQVVFDGILGKITEVFDGIKGAISSVVGRFDELKNAIANLSLPDWLTPGSPTPLELGLLGISDALQAVKVQLPGIGGLGAAASVTNSSQTNFNYSPTYNGAPPAPQREIGIMQVMWG